MRRQLALTRHSKLPTMALDLELSYFDRRQAALRTSFAWGS